MTEAHWIIDQLVQQGVRHFCVAPGSRNTPLVLAAAEHPKIKVHVHYDERGLGFFALGIGKAGRGPAALIATSGTAVGNLLPSVMEAHHTCTPLILLTADRPAELRDCSANQASDQIKIFQPFVRWQVDVPPSLNESYFRSIAAQGYFYARQNPPGPVQINCQYREPFSIPSSTPFPLQQGKKIVMEFPKLVGKPVGSKHSKGIILVGRLPDPNDIHSILDLAKRIQWPVFADILSNARLFPTYEQIQSFDWILKKGCDLKPEQILHFGDRLTSKKLLEWLKEVKADMTHVSPYPFLQDPARILTGRVQADIPGFCTHFQAPSDPHWLAGWQNLDSEISSLAESRFADSSPFTEAHAMRALARAIPSDFSIFLGNGMPIRDADHFLYPKKLKGFFCNRGLSGIDGNIATAAGIAEGLQAPVAAFIGDQATLHDLNSLPLLKKYPVFLIASNNFGSGIFHHLPIAKSPHFETYWAASHNWHFEMAAKMFDIPYMRLDSDPEEALGAVFQTRSSSLTEMITDRTENYLFQQQIQILMKECYGNQNI
ncbi:MAG TPA: 2-succinyl-5-enolpyruvyl-6-hydroxy-3-cyclohexene-1-carboxylic-acid synthase [Puia sp.]|nr:2-succinyl-5-enolpyruvyl-6-hydroxy-3-cyclohexene-1-carboxylic-acid synthase [Puia sp.]